MKTLLLGVGLGALMSLSALTTLAQTNQRPADAAQANAVALRQYEWKLRTEVQRKGETKNVQVVSVKFDSNGQKQTTVISKSPEPDLPKFGLRKAIAEKKVAEFRETVQQLGDLARSYAELSPEHREVVHKAYPDLAPSDEPPYPARGMEPLLREIAVVQKSQVGEGPVKMAVCILDLRMARSFIRGVRL